MAMGDRFIRIADPDIFWSCGSKGGGKGQGKLSTYVDLVHEALFNGRTSVFNSPMAAAKSRVRDWEWKPGRRGRRRPPCVSKEAILDAVGLSEANYATNLLDWGSSNMLALALPEGIHCLKHSNASQRAALPTVIHPGVAVASLSFAPDAHLLALGGLCFSEGFTNSQVQLWNPSSSRLVRTLTLTGALPTSLAWNPYTNYMLTTGDIDGKIVNHDVRSPSHVIHTYQGRGHGQEVCGLTWSGSGMRLASGGLDRLVHIWDLSMASNRRPWLHRLKGHFEAIRALAWCPFQSNLLASGGLESEGFINFWDTHTGQCLNSFETGSEVCALLWSRQGRELLSSHGSPHHQISLWEYPSMDKHTDAMGHVSPVMFMAQSPDGCSIASAAGDERLILWNLSENPRAARRPETFANFNTTISFRWGKSNFCWRRER